MNRLLLTSLAMVLFVGCSSSPKEEGSPDEVAGSTAAPWDSQPAPPTDSPVKAEAPRPVAPSVKSDGRDPWAELNAAIKSQDDEQIRNTSQEILRRVPNDEKALNSLALYHYRKGRFDLSAYLLGKAIQKAPNKGELHSNLGLVELARNERSAALKSFRRAMELNPDDGVAAANLGAMFVAEKDYTKAAIVLETNYRRGPRDAKTLNNYGIALTATGKYDKAKSVYEQGLKDSSSSKELLLNYAILLVEHMGDSKEGLDVINRLKFLGPPSESRERLSLLENKAKAGVK